MSADPGATAAFDQLGAVVSDIRRMVVMHYHTLVTSGMATDVSSMMAAEVQTALLAMLLSPDDKSEDE